MGKHAILSPSGAGRWIACTPSARLESAMPDRASGAADEGTLAHRYAEIELLWKLKRISATEHTMLLNDVIGHQYHSPEMDRCVKDYVEFVLDTYTGYGPEAQIFLEVKLDMTTWIPEGFGTSDVVITAPDVLHEIDLKYGKGVPVSALGNKQLRVYALGGLHHFGLVYDFKKVRMTIYQPRLEGESTDEITVDELETWANTVLRPKAELAWHGKGEFVTGEHCRFCRVAYKCRALADKNLEIARHEFKPSEFLTDDETAEVLALADQVRKWLTAVETHALSSALQGHAWPGYKLVQGRANRSWLDPALVVARLKSLGQPDEHIYAPAKVLSPAQVEKALGKEEAASVKDLIVKPTGKPALVPTTDKRPVYVPAEKDLEAFAQFADEEDETGTD